MNKKTHGYWTKKRLLIESKKYQSRSEWAKASAGSIMSARNFGKEFYEKCCFHMVPSKTKAWSKQNILKIVKKFKSRTEWASNSWGSYLAAKNFGNDFFLDCCKHMTNPDRKKWTKDRIIKAASKYKYVADWKKYSPGSYFAAFRSGKKFFKMVSKDMERKSRLIWTKHAILKEAKKFKTVSEWMYNSKGSYWAAFYTSKSFYKKCCRHMIKQKDSLGEKIIGQIFSYTFNVKFKKVKLSGIGEIDRFATLLIKDQLVSIGIEHQGIQHLEFSEYFHRTEYEFTKMKHRDAKKIKNCKKNNIKLLVINDLVKSYKLNGQKIKNKVERFLNTNNIFYDKVRFNKAINKYILSKKWSRGRVIERKYI